MAVRDRRRRAPIVLCGCPDGYDGRLTRDRWRAVDQDGNVLDILVARISSTGRRCAPPSEGYARYTHRGGWAGFRLAGQGSCVSPRWVATVVVCHQVIPEVPPVWQRVMPSRATTRSEATLPGSVYATTRPMHWA